ncbi:NAD-dependent epimerase/dehydratase family protein, partial [Streptomyces fulvissimus]|nr:NAD-dependent epimerase/dehydratase family protein [Streptomyces microflavus]
MRIAVAGSSGLIGTALTTSLRADGHEVVRLVRRPAR